ncbi:hypothetical protein [Allobaculum sp. JKK-2023]|uniref:hypothetical protein n=1 Tax=Allobaculum sp. JKK-2023 TaxID=3108943 RepID=UPI002B054185|nr:hypothetical protein [Allobaculum sp. JKK-2023]
MRKIKASKEAQAVPSEQPSLKKKQKRHIPRKRSDASIILDYILNASNGEPGLPSTLSATTFSLRPRKAKLVIK